MKKPSKEIVPRFGTWGLPAENHKELEQFGKFGLDFSSNRAGPEVQKKFYEKFGTYSNVATGMPTAEVLLEGLNLEKEDLDQDSEGRLNAEGYQISIFHDEVIQRMCDHIEGVVKKYEENEWVSSFMISIPISLYGEAHYAISMDAGYRVFGRPALNNFRNWLKKVYENDLQRLSGAWENQIHTWDEVFPPLFQEGEEGMDTRTCWSDFMHWYAEWLEHVLERCVQAARKHTDKPIALMLGGPKIGIIQGMAHGNIGPVTKLLGKYKPAFLSDTDSQTLFSVKYSSAACSLYGIDLMVEHIGPPYLEVFHQYNTLPNLLVAGASRVHLAHRGVLYDESHWFHHIWKDLSHIVKEYRTQYRKTQAAVFHSYLTSWYREDRSNADGVKVYDSTNTLWYPDRGYPSIGRVLQGPDVLDDIMVEDRALDGYKLLVIPNSSVTITSRKALDAMTKWVEAGGIVVGFGSGCLSHIVEPDRSITPARLMGGLIANKELYFDEINNMKDSSHREMEPVIQIHGKGKAVLFPFPCNPDGEASFDVDLIPHLLGKWVREAGITPWCSINPEGIHVLYCGREMHSGRHLFAGDFIRYVRCGLEGPIFFEDSSFQCSFHQSLTGEAELIAITDSFEKCEGGVAQYDSKSSILKIQFTLPTVLTLTFGKGRNGITLEMAPKDQHFPMYLP